MRSWRFQRGEIPMGCIVSLVLLAIVVLVGIKVTPVMLAMGDLDKRVRELADRGNRLEYTDKVITQLILEKAEENRLPVTAKDVKIKRSDSRIVVEVTYTKEIEFPGYTYRWNKRIYEDRPLF